MQLNLPIFMGYRDEEDPKDFVNEIEKIFRIKHVSDTIGREFEAYQLK